MKNYTIVIRKFLIAVAMMFCGSMVAIAADDFCWKDSYGRGVGEIPTQCTGGKEYQAGLCYDSCKPGFGAVGPVCWSACPSGYRDMGAICHIDKALLVKANWSCAKKVFGHCIWPKTSCPSGYTNAGAMCGLTAKSAPPGFSGTYLDPVKNSYGRGVGTIAKGCNGGDYDAGLCYTKCRVGYTGVGPVCWGKAPAGWAQCGMGAASTSAACGSAVFSQVSSVGQTAIFIATASASGDAAEAGTAGENASKLAALKQKFSEMSAAYKEQKALHKGIQDAEDAYFVGSKLNKARAAFTGVLDSGLNPNVTSEDLARVSAQIAAILDPSGVASTIAAYTYPKCSKLFPGR